MLTKTEDVLARHGIGSTRELQQRLYGEIGDAKIAGVLNQLAGNVFASPLKALSLVCTNAGCSDSDVLKEANRVVFGRDVSTKKIDVAGITYVGKFSSKPALIATSNGSGSLRMSKTIFGEMLGDVFAVMGIDAAADPEIGMNFQDAFGESFNSGGISTPLMSMLLAKWASREHDSPSLRNFVGDLGLAGNSSAEYKLVECRLSKTAVKLRKWDVVSYDSIGGTPSFYVAAEKKPADGDVWMRDGEAMSAIWKETVRTGGGTIKTLARGLNYSESHVQKVVNALLEKGYLKRQTGEPRNRRSSIVGRSRARKIWGYAGKACALVGFDPDNIGSVWKTPILDARRILNYRSEIVDPIVYGGPASKDFSLACRTAYDLNHAQRKKRYSN